MFFYIVRHLDSIASYLPTGLHLGFFHSWTVHKISPHFHVSHLWTTDFPPENSLSLHSLIHITKKMFTFYANMYQVLYTNTVLCNI